MKKNKAESQFFEAASLKNVRSLQTASMSGQPHQVDTQHQIICAANGSSMYCDRLPRADRARFCNEVWRILSGGREGKGINEEAVVVCR